MGLIRRFLFDDRRALIMQTPDVSPDPALVARNEQQAQRAKELLGERYVLHPANRKEKQHVSN